MDEISEADRKELISLAKTGIHNLNLLIAQCDSWLSEEELKEQRKKERAEWGWWKRLEWWLVGGI